MTCEEISIPPYFRCPISLDLFKDPVTLWTGQTYDRSCIQKWLSAGNSTCPVTMQNLHHDSSMVPNHTLRHLIHQWLHSNGYSDGMSENQMYIARLKHIIESSESESSESEMENKILALEEVHSLSRELPVENSCLIELGFFEMLVERVFGNGKSSSHQGKNVAFLEKALSCALELMRFSELGCLNVLQREPEFSTFVSLLENGTVSVKKALCLVVEAISSEVQTKHLCERLGNSVRAVRAIVRVVERERSNESEAGIRALAALSLTESNRENMARNGAVEGLVACLSSGERSAAMAGVESLLTSERRAREIVVNHGEGVRGVVRMVFRVSEGEGSASAVNALMIMCAESESGREKAIEEGVLTQLLLLLQSQSSANVKTKARMLLKMLRSKCLVQIH